MSLATRHEEINRRTFLKGTLAATAAAGMSPTALAEPAKKPNFVLFMMDQLAAKWIWGDAAKAVSLPNFDKLRTSGIAFESVCVSNPICAPSRASLATGLHTRGHGVLQNGYSLDPDLPTFTSELQHAGWATGGFGKIHHHPQFAGVHPDYRPYGYDVVFNTEDPRAGFWLDWIEKEHPKYYTEALACVGEFNIPELKAYGPNKTDLASKIQAIRKNFKWATSEFPENKPSRYTLPYPAEISQTNWITQHAIDFIEHTQMTKPVYAHISYVQVHSPSCPPPEFMKHVDPSLIPPPAGIEWLNDPLGPSCFPVSDGATRTIPDDWRVSRHYYLADLAHIDAQLGRVMKVLEDTGRLDNTYFILLSDHGSLLNDHGFTGKDERHYDSCIRVPLMISGPGLRRGIRCDELTQLEDIFPTILEMAGLPMPQPLMIQGADLARSFVNGEEHYPGRSLIGLCRGEHPNDWRDAVEIESYNNSRWTTTDHWARTIRTREFRYTFYPGKTGEQLFNLRNDPDEQLNLAGNPAFAALRAEMRDRLLDQIVLQDFPHTRRDCFSLGVY